MRTDHVVQRRWTYNQITADAEQQISRLMRQAEQTPTEGDSAHILRSIAFGVFVEWNSLTAGANGADVDRLRKMTELH